MIIILYHAYNRHTQCTKLQTPRNSKPHTVRRACFVYTIYMIFGLYEPGAVPYVRSLVTSASSTDHLSF